MYRGDWYHPRGEPKRWYTEDSFRPDGTHSGTDPRDEKLNRSIWAAMSDMVKP